MRSRACRIVNPINAFSFPLNVNPLQSVTSVALHSSVFFLDINLNIFSETKDNFHHHLNPDLCKRSNKVYFSAVLFKAQLLTVWQELDRVRVRAWRLESLFSVHQQRLTQAKLGPALPGQDKTGNCNQANSIPWQWQYPVQVAHLPILPSSPSFSLAATQSLGLGTLYTSLTLSRSHTFCTSDIL